MSNLFTERVLNMAAVTPQPEDYTGEDGLLYCGKCHTPKEAYFPEKQAALFGRDRHPAECDCQKAQRLEREAAEQRRKHLDTVEDLKRKRLRNIIIRVFLLASAVGDLMVQHSLMVLTSSIRPICFIVSPCSIG